MKTKAKIKYGKKSVLDGVDLERDVKVRITTMIDEPVLKALRARAAKSGEGYQTLIQRILREWVSKDHKDLEDRVSELEQLVKRIAS